MLAAWRQQGVHSAAAVGAQEAQRGRLHVVGDDGQPRAYEVRLGITDGTATEVLVLPGSPLGAVLKEGATVVTGLTGGAAPTARPTSGPRLPF